MSLCARAGRRLLGNCFVTGMLLACKRAPQGYVVYDPVAGLPVFTACTRKKSAAVKPFLPPSPGFSSFSSSSSQLSLTTTLGRVRPIAWLQLAAFVSKRLESGLPCCLRPLQQLLLLAHSPPRPLRTTMRCHTLISSSVPPTARHAVSPRRCQ